MKRFFLMAIVWMLLSSSGITQSKLGEVACVYVTTSDLDSSLSVYEKLGFQKIASNTFPVPWVQASDGSLIIMMRQDSNPYIGLTYYAAEVEKLAEQLEKDSIIFSQKPEIGDMLKRFYIKSPDGFNIVLSNNPGNFEKQRGPTLLTMKPEDYSSPEKFPNKQCGAFGEFCHPVTDLNASIAFWKKLGFTVKNRMNTPYPYAILSDGLMIIGLHQTKDFNYPAVTYFGLNTDKRVQELKGKGVHGFSEMMGKNNVILKTWEGQHFFLFSLGM